MLALDQLTDDRSSYDGSVIAVNPDPNPKAIVVGDDIHFSINYNPSSHIRVLSLNFPFGNLPMLSNKLRP